LGRRSLNTLDFTCLFRFFQHVTERPGSTHCSSCIFSGETLSLWWGGTTHLVLPHRGLVRRRGIRSQRLKYANTLASLAKRVLRDILDTIDVCNDSDQPFAHLKEVLLGNLERVNGSLNLTCFVSPWKCKASSQALSWGNSNSISLQELVRTRTFCL
jgi:hypothetical protein